MLLTVTVLILVLVEVMFSVIKRQVFEYGATSLNPCFSGSYVLCMLENSGEQIN